ncbi:phage holin family protein [Pleomorphovibrio marinus]|uniref:phage holin family protein n=1 Tax=Pleomorphovibrio marinus TaxID=2164132 RepID=UPI000E0BD1E5|nr:phage holin family protein [Pleomorphovibrio marinus]
MLNLSELINTLKKLIEIRIKILLEEIKDDLSTIFTRVVVLVFMVLTSLFILLFGSIALAFYFAVLMESTHAGFLMVGGIYLFILLILFLIRNSFSLQSSLKRSLTSFLFIFKRK